MKIKDTETKKELLEVASKMLRGEISLIEGSDWIDSLIDTTKDEYDFLLSIKGIVSQADDIIRKKYSMDYEGFIYIELVKYQKDLEEYFQEVKPIIWEICEEIIEKYGKELEKK